MTPEERVQAIEAQLQRAKNHPNKTGVLRKETLNTLIRATHSPSTKLKLLAATNIQYFFKDFPELEEQAINAVYDLCEDPSPEVRVEGYKAITGISKTDRRLVKRNADVLLQLLQSDEPSEVTVVEKALLEHIDLDARVTLGVLCDQIAPVGSSIDEEERAIRDKLRFEVVMFLITRALPSIRRYAKPNSPLEDLMLDSLIGVAAQVEWTDLNSMLYPISLALPSKSVSSPKGDALVQTLLNRVGRAARNFLKAKSPTLAMEFDQELGSAVTAVTSYSITSPLALFQYFCNSLTGKIFLQQLPPASQLLLVEGLTDLIDFCQKSFPSDPEILVCQWKVVDACPYLLEVLAPSLSDKPSPSIPILLRACLNRKNSQGWTITPNLRTVLEKLKAEIEKSPLQELRRDILKMLMFLLPPATSSQSASTANEPPRGPRVVQTAATSGHLPGRLTPSAPPSSSSTLERSTSQDQPPPAKKRRSISNIGEPQKASLLSRLQPPPSSDSAAMPQGQGLSIKGAASSASNGHIAPKKLAPLSLLDRLQDANPGFLPDSGDSGPASDSRKRKRGGRAHLS